MKSFKDKVILRLMTQYFSDADLEYIYIEEKNSVLRILKTSIKKSILSNQVLYLELYNGRIYILRNMDKENQEVYLRHDTYSY